MAFQLPSEWASWQEEGARLIAAPSLRRSEQSTRGPADPKFALGDFLAGIPAQYVKMLAEALGRDPAQFRIYRDVAEKVPADRRVAASWTVHRDLRDRPDLLTDGLTVRQAAALQGKKPIDAKPERRLTLEERAARVRSALADPEVHALIDAELEKERTARKQRRLAGRVVSEHSKRKRELEAELRALRSAMSPLEATVKTELRINDATQLVEAINQVLDDLYEPERVIAALTDLKAAISALLVDHQPAERSEDEPNVINPEMWQDRSARAGLTDSHQRNLSREGQTVIDLHAD